MYMIRISTVSRMGNNNILQSVNYLDEMSIKILVCGFYLL